MEKDTSKTTILIISLGFILLYLLLNNPWFLYITIGLITIGAFSNWGSHKIEFLWFKLSLIFSKIFPRLLLSILFYFILFPISVLSKIFTKDPLFLENNNNSTFKDVIAKDFKADMEKTW